MEVTPSRNVTLASRSPYKMAVVDELKRFFPHDKFRYVAVSTSHPQPIDELIAECMGERLRQLQELAPEEDILLVMESGIIQADNGYQEICRLLVDSGAQQKTYQSFAIDISSELFEAYRATGSTGTFGNFLAWTYPVLGQNWTKSHYFGGVDRQDQFRHVLSQWVLDRFTRVIPDFPKPGVLFKDISSVTKSASLFGLMHTEFKKMILRNVSEIDYFAGLESRGYYLAASLAQELGKGMVPIRKSGKLPKTDDVLTIKYGTEYSQDEIGLIESDEYRGANVVIVDDLIATGGSLLAAHQLCRAAGMQVVGSAVVYCVAPLLASAMQKFKVPPLVLCDHSATDVVAVDHDVYLPAFKFSRPGPPDARIIACSGSEYLAEAIHCISDIKMCPSVIAHFGNGETRVEIRESIRGTDVTVVCVTRNGAINNDFLSLCMVLDACRRSGANSVNVVLPYYPYSRSDKRDAPRVPIGAAAIAGILESYHVDNIISLDLHAGQLQGLIDRGFHNIYIINVMCDYIRTVLDLDSDKHILISPDAGSIKRLEAYSKKLGVEYVILHKQRDYSKPGTVVRSMLIGDKELYRDKVGIVIDDMADTMGTMVAACDVLRDHGLVGMHTVVTHGVLSGPAIDRINGCEFIQSVVVTNTLPQTENARRCPKIKIVDCAPLITRAIEAIAKNESVSALWE